MRERRCSTCGHMDVMLGTGVCRGCFESSSKPNWSNWKKGESEMVNLVFVKFSSGNKTYLFRVPSGKQLLDGDKVYVDTKYGESIVECVSSSFIVDIYSAIAIKRGCGLGSLDTLKYVVGQAVEKEVVVTETKIVKVLF